ncbi:MAG: 4Fe-4S dicluster domain-containing protein, partial [Candidatus Nanopelagicales bacterium]|nr:4Fe-4S dicluster domain-containing protein [Candidatus Nanopelagicales bacterium]
MTIMREHDYGTPAKTAADSVTVSIDGHEVSIPAGTSVLRAASEAGLPIPKLCATDSLEPFGSCRLCLVEIDGKKGTPASCTTPCEAGMVVHTRSPKLDRLRLGVMELYISDHPLDCLTCPANGDCELQDMAGVVGLRHVRYGYAGENHLDAPTDDSNPYFSFDESKCIVCSRCVRACSEVQGTFALTIEGRGFNSKVSPGGLNFLESECVSCGACVQACPTSTLQEKAVIQIGTPTRTVLTTCAYCGVGCTFKAEMRGDELVRMVPYKDGGANEGHSCVKGRFAFGYTSHPDRVLNPMIRESITDPWREVQWEEAIGYAATKLKEIQEKYGVDSIG